MNTDQKNAKSKISAQFMSGGSSTKSPSRKKVEESVRMGGYEVSFKCNKIINKETQEPMSGHSEFWIG
ncbi:MAG: hypothetical protein LBQ60_15220 [Bacteroidales bacterium]|jgi:hypothetical protein|nr:hypothetical protein [Bacteroidales bacterium]